MQCLNSISRQYFFLFIVCYSFLYSVERLVVVFGFCFSFTVMDLCGLIQINNNNNNISHLQQLNKFAVSLTDACMSGCV